MDGQLIKFDDVFGQSAAIEALTTAYRLDRLPHALIFSGPMGVGKATTARALAGLFLCEKPRELAPCGKCESCRSFHAGTHPDYHIVERKLIRLENKDSKARDLAADVVRHFLIEKAAMKSVVGVGKMFVIEEAELMNATAQNALLKTLEEPAGRTLIILLTDQPESLLSTIRSRSRLVRFAPLDSKAVRSQLEKRGIPRETASAAAGVSEGSLGLALRWIEDGVVEKAQELFQMLGRVIEGETASALQPWLKAASDAHSEVQIKRDKQTSVDQSKREGLILYLKLAAQYFRERMKDSSDDPDRLSRLCDGIDAVVRSEGYVESNVTVALVLQQFAGAVDRAMAATSR